MCGLAPHGSCTIFFHETGGAAPSGYILSKQKGVKVYCEQQILESVFFGLV